MERLQVIYELFSDSVINLSRNEFIATNTI